MTRRNFVGAISASAFFSLDLLADTAELELTNFRPLSGAARGFAFDLKAAKNLDLASARVYAMPKRVCLFRELTPESRYPFPWNGKEMVAPVELKPVKTRAGVAAFEFPVSDLLECSATYVFRGICAGKATALRDASVAALAKAAGNAALLDEIRRAYWAQGTKEISINREWALGGERAYQMAKTGTVVVEIDIPGAKPGKPVDLVAWGDNHLKFANDEDRKSDNIMAAFARRGEANPPTRGSQSLAREMDLVPFFDGAAILGDNVDFFSYGSYEVWKRMALDVSTEPLVVIGYHDYVTHTINKRPQREMPPSVTMPVCRKYTPNDVRYATKLIANRVLMVGVDASRNGNFYWEDNVHGQLAADVKRARANGWTILLFQHEGQYLNTWTKGADGTYDAKADDAACVRHTMTATRKMNYRGYGGIIMDPAKSAYSQARGTKAVYDIIWNNADVIRGVFHGHVHANYASWIQAKTPSGEPKPIPQYSCNGSVFFDNGWVFRIHVK